MCHIVRLTGARISDPPVCYNAGMTDNIVEETEDYATWHRRVFKLAEVCDDCGDAPYPWAGCVCERDQYPYGPAPAMPQVVALPTISHDGKGVVGADLKLYLLGPMAHIEVGLPLNEVAKLAEELTRVLTFEQEKRNFPEHSIFREHDEQSAD